MPCVVALQNFLLYFTVLLHESLKLSLIRYIVVSKTRLSVHTLPSNIFLFLHKYTFYHDQSTAMICLLLVLHQLE